MIKMNRKGGEKLLSIWWFFVLALIGGSIVAGVIIFYGAEIDTRKLETDIMSEKIVNCISEQGFLNENMLNKNFDVFKECSISKGLVNKGGEFYLRISIYDEQNNKIREDVVSEGPMMEKDCIIGERMIRARYYPVCSKKRENILYYKDGQLNNAVLEVMTASNQRGQEVAIIA